MNNGSRNLRSQAFNNNSNQTLFSGVDSYVNQGIYSRDPVAQSSYSDKNALSMDKRTGLLHVQNNQIPSKDIKVT